MKHWKSIWGIAMVAGCFVVTATAQDTYVWSGNANLNWNTTDANWQIDGTGAHVPWTDGNIARFTSVGAGTVTLTQDIVAHGLELTAARALNRDGTKRVLRLGAGGIDMANGSQLNIDGANWFEVRLTADQTWNTRNSSIILLQNANVNPGQIVTDIPGIVLTVDSTGFSSFDVGALQSGFNGISFGGFEGTLVLNTGRLLGGNGLWHMGGVVLDLANNMEPFKTGAALGLGSQAIVGLQGGASAFTTPASKGGWVRIGGSGTYTFNAALGGTKFVTMDGTGTQIFTGNLVHTGVNTVNAGTLRINGTHVNAADYIVNAGGTLGGSGTITFDTGTLTVNSGGILDPGAAAGAVGTLNIVGNATLEEGAVYNWTGGGGDGDLVHVDGELTLPTVATIHISATDSNLPDPAVIFESTQALAGATDLSGWNVDGTLSIIGNAVVLEFPPEQTYVWTGDAGDGLWNTTSANWTTDGGATHVPWVNSSLFSTAQIGAPTGNITLTEEIRAHGLVFTAGRQIYGSGGLRKLKIGSGGITGPGNAEVYFHVLSAQLQVVITADQTWVTGGNVFRFNAQNAISSIATQTDGLVLTITSTGGQGGLRGFGHFSLADFNGTIRAHSGWVMLVTRLWYADNVLFDMMDNNTANAWTAADVSPQPIRGLINGGASGRAAFHSNDQVEFVGAGTYAFAARLGTANRVLKSGSGTQIFTGALDHTGDTTITGGDLRINGTHVNATNYTVNAGGTLGGSGTITLVTGASLTVNNGGILDPGAAEGAIGTLNIAGDMTLASGAVYNMEYDGASADLVDVTGTLTLPAAMTVNITGTGEASDPFVLFEFGDKAGATDLSGWTVNTTLGGILAIVGNQVVLYTPPPGTLFRFN